MANAPIHKIKYGSISLAVFENTGKNKQGESFTSTSPTLSRSYQDKQGNWVNVNFGMRNSTEVINAIQCLQAYLDYKYRKDEAAENKPAF
jgi:hypothetical protein